MSIVTLGIINRAIPHAQKYDYTTGASREKIGREGEKLIIIKR